MRLTGILRDPTFSPAQHAENDRLILELTAEQLRRRGCRVDLMQEAEVGRRCIDSPAVFSMCQGPRANHELRKLERRGLMVINSPVAVQSCYRVNLLRILGQHWAVLAPMTMVDTDSAADLTSLFAPGEACWIKRGDVHATQQGDVVKVCSIEECGQVLAGLRFRGVAQAVIQRHIKGEVVKFYGVMGNSFFRFYSERDRKVAPVAFWSARSTVEKLVDRVGLLVYGGDAVLTEDGQVAIIDINDWPSFACFRADAADAIAERIHQQAASLLPERKVSGLVGISAYHSRR